MDSEISTWIFYVDSHVDDPRGFPSQSTWNPCKIHVDIHMGNPRGNLRGYFQQGIHYFDDVKNCINVK